MRMVGAGGTHLVVPELADSPGRMGRDVRVGGGVVRGQLMHGAQAERDCKDPEQ
jgi:hypothetical protein